MPPAGDGRFDQLDIVAAQQAGVYLAGPYSAVNPGGAADDRPWQGGGGLGEVESCLCCGTFKRIAKLESSFVWHVVADRDRFGHVSAAGAERRDLDDSIQKGPKDET